MRGNTLTLALVTSLAACRMAPNPRLAGPAASKPDVAGAIARVEGGLIPEVRVAGEPRGWSLDERLREHHTPGVSVAVIEGGRVAWARAWGTADLRTGAVANVDTLFQAASISKLVTAVAALRAVDRGQVELDGDVHRALRGWTLAGRAAPKRPVTLAQLLSHTAGVNLRSVHGYPAGSPLPTLRQILDGAPPATTAPVRIDHEPGVYRYSGGGFLVVQELLEEVSGLSFAEVMEREVFAPAGMTHSSFAVPLPPAARAQAATPHDVDGSAFPELVYPDAAPAGLWTTPTDLARLLLALARAREGTDESLLSQRLARRMTTSVAEMGHAGVSIGLGPALERHGAAVYFGHDGWNEGFLSVARATLDGRHGAVVMANGAESAPLILEIIRSIAAEYQWPGWLAPPVTPVAVPAAHLEALGGPYVAGSDTSIDVRARGNRLEAREPFGEPVELLPLGSDVFLARDETRFVFRVGPRGGFELTRGAGADATTFTRSAHPEGEPLRALEAGRESEALARYRALQAAHRDDDALRAERFDALATHLLDRRLDAAAAARVFRVGAALHPESASLAAGLALALLRQHRRAEAAPWMERAKALEARAALPEMESILLRARLARLTRAYAGA